MKITILSEIDYAGSAHKLWEALWRYTNHDVDIYTGKYYNPFRHPDNSDWKRKDVQRRINESDVIHLKGDFPPKDGYMGFKIMHKPIVCTVSGSKFRKTSNGGYQTVHPWQFRKAQLLTAFTPDLLYPEYSDTWTPHPIDSLSVDNIWKSGVTLMHTPSDRGRKYTEFFLEIAYKLQKWMHIEVELLEKMDFHKVMEERKRATIFFDQFHVGFYGNAAIEAMQYGIPVCAWISPSSMAQANLSLCPVISVSKRDPELWAEKLIMILNNDMTELSIRTKDWCDSVHSYQSVAKQWNELYLQLEI